MSLQQYLNNQVLATVSVTSTTATTTFLQIYSPTMLMATSGETIWDTIFRDYTIVTHKLFESGSTHSNTNLISPQNPTELSINAGAVWANGDNITNEATVFIIFFIIVVDLCLLKALLLHKIYRCLLCFQFF